MDSVGVGRGVSAGFARTVPGLALVLLLLPALPVAQVWPTTKALPVRPSVIVVDAAGGGDFTTVQAAVDAAASGDVLLLRASTYSSVIPNFNEEVVIDGKSLTVLRDSDTPVAVHKLTIENLAASQTVIVRGVEVNARGWHLFGELPAHGDALVASGNAGAVRIEDCPLSGGEGYGIQVYGPPEVLDGDAAARIENCASVALLRCTLAGGPGADIIDEDFQYQTGPGGPALLAVASTVTAQQCSLQGGAGGTIQDTVLNTAGTGGDGVVNDGSTLRLAGCTANGGKGGNGDCDTHLALCGSGAPGGNGLFQPGDALTSILDSSFTGGAGGISPGVGPEPDGLPRLIDGGYVTDFPQAFGTLAVTSPVREHEAGQVDVQAQASDAIYMLVSLDTADGFVYALSGTLLVDSFLVVPLGSIAPSGAPLALPFHLPDMGAGIDVRNVFMQLVVVHAGDASLGGCSMMTVLDAAL